MSDEQQVNEETELRNAGLITRLSPLQLDGSVVAGKIGSLSEYEKINSTAGYIQGAVQASNSVSPEEMAKYQAKDRQREVENLVKDMIAHSLIGGQVLSLNYHIQQAEKFVEWKENRRKELA